jgi:hypothetical protein
VEDGRFADCGRDWDLVDCYSGCRDSSTVFLVGLSDYRLLNDSMIKTHSTYGASRICPHLKDVLNSRKDGSNLGHSQ